ncbi:hypothetical protein [Novosphingobium sp.]|uniref:hypothetical protein n=1 Tax=Novosphingobium sp. TaxID=1874826 RepID=UPI00260D3C84|nr:hypothetical protein [Novosphingobium sp.]
MNQETNISETIRSALETPFAERIGDVFENSPLLASVAAFATTRIALRSLSGLVAVGLIAGGLLYIQRSRATGLDEARRIARKAAKKAAKEVRKVADAVTA